MAHSVDMIQPMLDAAKQESIVIAACLIGILFGVYNAWWVLRIKVNDAEGG